MKRMYVESVSFTIQLRNGKDWYAIENNTDEYSLSGRIYTSQSVDFLNTISDGINKLIDELEDLEAFVESRRMAIGNTGGVRE